MNFRIIENGVERATCPAAGAGTQDAPLTCEFFVAGGSASDDSTPYIFLAYTTDAIAFINNTTDRWMATNVSTIYNFNPAISNPGASLIFGDPALLRDDFRVGFGDVTLLAPNQCIVFTLIGGTNNNPPQACDVIASRPLDTGVAFWLANFEVGSATDDRRRSCPAPTPGRTTLCILPR